MVSRQASSRHSLSREAVAAALALAGVRSGALVLDLAPDAGLTRAARAAAGSGGRVDTTPAVGRHTDQSVLQPDTGGLPEVRYGHAIGVWPAAGGGVVAIADRARPLLAPYARVTRGAVAPLPSLVHALRESRWTVLHSTTLPADVALVPPGDPSADLALVVARSPE